MRPARGARALHEDQGGQAMVEFVLVFPIQLLLSLTIVQFAFLAHAHVVVGHAAFMGARAAAVADDGLMQGLNQQDAARREAARILSVLTSGEPPGGDGGARVPSGGELRWQAEGGGHQVAPARQAEAYAHLEVDVQPEVDDGYVSCLVTFDYPLQIPVANHFFARLGRGGGGGAFFFGREGAYNTASQARGETVFQIRRVGFISTPWTKPVGGGQ